MGLMYSRKEDRLVNRAEMAQLITPPPMGTNHHPYPFADYVDNVTDALSDSGLRILTEEYAVSNDDNRMFGLLEVGPLEGQLITADDWKVVVGLRGSHDQRIPRGLVIGTQVMVCSNLCFHGNITQVKTKQTTHIGERLPLMLREAVQHIPQMADFQQEVFEKWRNHRLTDQQANDMLVEMYLRGAFSSPQLTAAINEFYEPTFGEHMEDGRTAWTLFNASTQALKPTGSSTNMNLVHDRSRKVSDYLEELVA